MPAAQPTPPPLVVDEERSSARQPLRAVPFRFSLRTLLRLMTGLAVVFGLGSMLPDALTQIVLGMLWLVASGWLITGILFAKGDARAFCIGATVVVTSMWTGIGGGLIGGIRTLLRGSISFWSGGSASGYQVLETWLIHALLVIVAVGNGYLCILARRYFEQESK